MGSFVKSENYSVAGCVRLNAKPMFKLGVKAPIVTILYAVETPSRVSKSNSSMRVLGLTFTSNFESH